MVMATLGQDLAAEGLEKFSGTASEESVTGKAALLILGSL